MRALAAALKKGKGPAASASAGATTAGGRASGAGASGAGASGTPPPIDDGLLNKNIQVCFSITYKEERGKKAMTEKNFLCPGTIESVSDESTVLGRKKLGCGWVFVNYRDGEADWQLLHPTFFNAKKPGGWRIVESAAELETNFQFEDLSEGD